MRYAAVFASASDRAAVAAWLAGVFGDDPSGAERNLGVPLTGAGGAAWSGGCAAVDAAMASALSPSAGGALVAISEEMEGSDPGAPARWWLAQAAAAGLTRPMASALD